MGMIISFLFLVGFSSLFPRAYGFVKFLMCAASVWGASMALYMVLCFITGGFIPEFLCMMAGWIVMTPIMVIAWYAE